MNQNQAQLLAQARAIMDQIDWLADRLELHQYRRELERLAFAASDWAQAHDALATVQRRGAARQEAPPAEARRIA